MPRRANGRAVCVARRADHHISKNSCRSITLAAGLGVVGDAHYGKTVKHRSRVAKDPSQPNLRQVHLVHSELFGELAQQGFTLGPAQMGENITTKGIDLLALPTGTRLLIGSNAIIEITGLRNPCNQINGLAKGMMQAMLSKDSCGNLVRKAGVMGIVIAGGEICAGDRIVTKMPSKPYQKLLPV